MRPPSWEMYPSSLLAELLRCIGGWRNVHDPVLKEKLRWYTKDYWGNEDMKERPLTPSDMF